MQSDSNTIVLLLKELISRFAGDDIHPNELEKKMKIYIKMLQIQTGSTKLPSEDKILD